MIEGLMCVKLQYSYFCLITTGKTHYKTYFNLPVFCGLCWCNFYIYGRTSRYFIKFKNSRWVCEKLVKLQNTPLLIDWRSRENRVTKYFAEGLGLKRYNRSKILKIIDLLLTKSWYTEWAVVFCYFLLKFISYILPDQRYKNLRQQGHNL